MDLLKQRLYEMIDQAMETENLSEDVYPDLKNFGAIKDPKDLGIPDNNKPSASSVFNVLRRLAEPETDLDLEDFVWMMNHIDDISTDIQHKLIAIKKSTNTPQDLKDNAIAILDAIDAKSQEKGRQAQSITRPSIRTAPAAYKAPGASGGHFSPEVKAILDGLFKPKDDTIKRIQKLSEVSKLYFDASGGDTKASRKIKSKPLKEFMNEVMLLDYFAEISKSFDEGAGGYVFEYFLALLTGGHVTGKETASAGGMGGVDFRNTDGRAGSAKWYQKGYNITQAPAGFKIGEPIDYIVGLKKQGKEQLRKTSRGVSSPEKLMAVDIYYFQLTRESDTVFKLARLNKVGKPTGNPKRIDAKKDKKTGKLSKLKFDKYISDDTYLDTIYLAKVRTGTFREMVHGAVKHNNNQIKKKLINLVDAFFKNLNSAEVESKKYMSTGNIDHGLNTKDALVKADDNFEEIGNLYFEQGEEEYEELSENKIEKITPESLDNMIKRVIFKGK